MRLSFVQENGSVGAKLNTKQKCFRHFCIFIVDYDVSLLVMFLFFLFLTEPRGQDCQKCFITHLSANFLRSPKFVKRHSDDKLRVNVVLKHLQQLCDNFLFPNMFFLLLNFRRKILSEKYAVNICSFNKIAPLNAFQYVSSNIDIND